MKRSLPGLVLAALVAVALFVVAREAAPRWFARPSACPDVARHAP